MSDRSATLAHGLPILGDPPVRAELAVPPGHWTGTRTRARLRIARLVPEDVVPAGEVIAGLPAWAAAVPVTSEPRTWVDVTRSGGLNHGLVIGDALLRRESSRMSDLQAALAALPHGNNSVELALQHLSPLRETALESLSFGHFVSWGIPLPQMQVVIHDEDGFAGRVDFVWEDLRVIGEADGVGKYQSRGALIAEKRREDRLRRLGYVIVRWTWDELVNEPWVVLERIARALRLAA